MAEFDWWLLVLGLVVGGGLVYLVLADSARREADLEAKELEAEATFISERLADQGLKVSREDVADVLREHRAYLTLPPPDAIVSPDDEAAAPDSPAVLADMATPPESSQAIPRARPLSDSETRA